MRALGSSFSGQAGFVEQVAQPPDFDVQLSVASTTIGVSWAAVPGAIGYNVYCGLSTDTMLPVVTALQGTGFTIGSLTAGNQYFVQVEAVLSPRAAIASVLLLSGGGGLDPSCAQIAAGTAISQTVALNAYVPAPGASGSDWQEPQIDFSSGQPPIYVADYSSTNIPGPAWEGGKSWVSSTNAITTLHPGTGTDQLLTLPADVSSTLPGSVLFQLGQNDAIVLEFLFVPGRQPFTCNTGASESGPFTVTPSFVAPAGGADIYWHMFLSIQNPNPPGGAFMYVTLSISDANGNTTGEFGEFGLYDGTDL